MNDKNGTSAANLTQRKKKKKATFAKSIPKVIRKTLVRTQSDPTFQRRTELKKQQLRSIRHDIGFVERRFDVLQLPADLRRIYEQVKEDNNNNEEYALVCVFLVRTAVELHRAWHMTLLTNKILQQIKDKFDLRMTWNLGVFKLRFFFEDGRYVLNRKVPYDYDSEYQDLYMKVAAALVENHITIDQALLFQKETKDGKHTAKSGLFLRDYPGRLVLYPIEAATCAVIFFGGDWADAGVAALTGLATGLIEWLLNAIGGEAKVLVDVCAGTATGVIAGLFYRFDGQNYCLSAIFLGTLYWFFYGTAFVLGFLEIIAGELETGVTRFIAVSVKTFVLSIGSAFGMHMALVNPFEAWVNQERQQCGTIDLNTKWWRIPLYLLCSASALGQYRFPVSKYWRGLIVQLVGYEVQYQMFLAFASRHQLDFLDTASSNVGGAAAAVVAASALSYVVDLVGYYYHGKILRRYNYKEASSVGKFMYKMTAYYVRFTNFVGVGRATDLTFLQMKKKLRDQEQELNDPQHPRSRIELQEDEEMVLVEGLVGAQNLNIWALLMPTVYQLVPGSLIARLWYNAVFPPPPLEETQVINGTDLEYNVFKPNPAEDVIYSLTVVATSLALGLIIGLALVNLFGYVWVSLCCQWNCQKYDPETDVAKEAEEIMERKNSRRFIMGAIPEDDPDSPENLAELEQQSPPEEVAVEIDNNNDNILDNDLLPAGMLQDFEVPVSITPGERHSSLPIGIGDLAEVSSV